MYVNEVSRGITVKHFQLSDLHVQCKIILTFPSFSTLKIYFCKWGRLFIQLKFCSLHLFVCDSNSIVKVTHAYKTPQRAVRPYINARWQPFPLGSPSTSDLTLHRTRCPAVRILNSSFPHWLKLALNWEGKQWYQGCAYDPTGFSF